MPFPENVMLTEFWITPVTRERHIKCVSEHGLHWSQRTSWPPRHLPMKTAVKMERASFRAFSVAVPRRHHGSILQATAKLWFCHHSDKVMIGSISMEKRRGLNSLNLKTKTKTKPKKTSTKTATNTKRKLFLKHGFWGCWDGSVIRGTGLFKGSSRCPGFNSKTPTGS